MAMVRSEREKSERERAHQQLGGPRGAPPQARWAADGHCCCCSASTFDPAAAAKLAIAASTGAAKATCVESNHRVDWRVRQPIGRTSQIVLTREQRRASTGRRSSPITDDRMALLSLLFLRCVVFVLFRVQNSVQSYFESLILRVPKLYGVLVTDRDGVALVRGQPTGTGAVGVSAAVADGHVSLAVARPGPAGLGRLADGFAWSPACLSVRLSAMGDVISELQVDPSLSSSFTSAAEQSGKLSIGYNLSLTSYFDNYTLVQMNLLPLVVSLLAAPDANVQLINNCMPEIARVLEPVRTSVQQTVTQTSREEQ